MPEVYSLSATFMATGANTPASILSNALDAWIRRRYPGDELPPLLPSAAWARRTTDGAIIRWEVFDSTEAAKRSDAAGMSVADGASLYELTWRHLHNFEQSPYLPAPGSPEVWWSTRVSCVVEPDGSTSLAVRVSNTGPAIDSPDVLRTTRPRFLIDLAKHGKLAVDGASLTTVPKALSPVDVGDVVRYVLFDPARRTPIAVLSPRADGRYVLPPSVVAEDLFTLASVYVISTPAATFALTDALGRRELSAFHGALRVYLPGLRADSNPLEHPLVTSTRLVDRSTRSRLAAYLALRTPERFVDNPRFAMLRDERAAYEDARRRAVERALEASVQEARAAGDYQVLAELFSRDNEALSEQVRSLTADLEDARAQMDRLDGERRRLRYLLDQRENAEPASLTLAPELPAPTSVRDAVDQAAEFFADHLLFLPDAWDSAQKSPYERPEEILRTLQVLAQLAERRASPQGLGQPFSEACKDEGLDYAPGISKNTSKRLRRQYEHAGEDGTIYFCPEHIVLGSSYDPRFCARIYFTSRSSEEDRIIIGHVGRHLEVATTT